MEVPSCTSSSGVGVGVGVGVTVGVGVNVGVALGRTVCVIVAIEGKAGVPGVSNTAST